MSPASLGLPSSAVNAMRGGRMVQRGAAARPMGLLPDRPALLTWVFRDGHETPPSRHRSDRIVPDIREGKRDPDVLAPEPGSPKPFAVKLASGTLCSKTAPERFRNPRRALRRRNKRRFDSPSAEAQSPKSAVTDVLPLLIPRDTVTVTGFVRRVRSAPNASTLKLNSPADFRGAICTCSTTPLIVP